MLPTGFVIATGTAGFRCEYTASELHPLTVRPSLVQSVDLEALGLGLGDPPRAWGRLDLVIPADRRAVQAGLKD
jgi:hypothetical protein